MKVHTRSLEETDYAKIKALLLGEGANEWNYIPEEGIDHQIELLKQHMASVALLENQEIQGFSIMLCGDACRGALKKYDDLDRITFIADVVVSRIVSGQGLGTQLLFESLRVAKEKGFETVYIERHEENLASAGMMRKAGFELVDIYDDPAKRSSGSRRSALLKKSI